MRKYVFIQSVPCFSFLCHGSGVRRKDGSQLDATRIGGDKVARRENFRVPSGLVESDIWVYPVRGKNDTRRRALWDLFASRLILIYLNLFISFADPPVPGSVSISVHPFPAVRERRDVTLKCNAVAAPASSYRWFFEGKIILVKSTGVQPDSNGVVLLRLRIGKIFSAVELSCFSWPSRNICMYSACTYSKTVCVAHKVLLCVPWLRGYISA